MELAKNPRNENAKGYTRRLLLFLTAAMGLGGSILLAWLLYRKAVASDRRKRQPETRLSSRSLLSHQASPMLPR